MKSFTLKSPIPLRVPASSLQTHQKYIIRITKRSHFLKSSSPCYTRFSHGQHPVSKVVRSSMRNESNDKHLDAKDAALLVNNCITRNLPLALSLDQGLDTIKEAVEELKTNPPPCSSGMYRFQLAVPPSAKALNWFCSQPESSNVFPTFFLSNEKENPTYKSLSLGRTRGVFGIGSAVNFKGFSSHAPEENNAFQRFLPAESTSSNTYGFVDTEVDTNTSTIREEIGSYYLFIPHIVLDESEDISFLVATIAWDDSSMCTFDEAVQLFELSFDQASDCSFTDRQLVHSSLSKLKSTDEHRQMARFNSLLLDEKHLEGQQYGTSISSIMRDASSNHSQFSARLAPNMIVANNMNQKDEVNQVTFFSEECPNINILWASLIVEECVRHGLTYFCVAPGSRSSPLTLAAASHPLTTCIACIDERSLAFHAIGYAKGSHKPAVIITSSGTAVSNLFPAVVEASQNFVPLLLLTADRPPELVDVGANQAINQVNHYSGFARQYFGLPPPSDDISARYVLTAVDAAVFKATSSPYGPVHINCPFRDPLAKSPRIWNHSCLNGLDIWMSNAEPFTCINSSAQQSLTSNYMYKNVSEVVKLVQGANRGILILGSIYKEDDIWAALMLAKHLMWPVVVDIQSGLRLRKYVSSSLDKKDILFVDQLDQLLMSDSFRSWMKADVIVQIGSRITGRRISQMIENCSPCTYIMVDEHPGRHDPSNIMTHRIQSTITQFSDCLIKSCTPKANELQREFIRGLDMMAAWETSYLINSEQSLTEPYVARKIFEGIRCGSALFYGNSMPIRDADMYGSNWVQCSHSASLMLTSGLPCHPVEISGNRGASGIDGLISTAIGFAVGCNKRVLMVIGDVSFLHDTNGLALLKQHTRRKPMVIVVVNNHGGAIFSQLPVANTTERNILDQFFYTTHNVSIRDLCQAHGVKHVQVQKKSELDDALSKSQQEDEDCIVEVESGIDTNIEFHSNLRNFTRQSSDHAFNILSKLSVSGVNTEQAHITYKIDKLEYSLYRVQLNAPPTSVSRSSSDTPSYREGFIISLSLEDGSLGFGEIAPLEIHKENLLDVEEQLRFLVHVMKGKTFDNNLSLLKYSVSSWIWNTLGIQADSIFPSVRCGLEMAILSAIASRQRTNLLDVLRPGKEELSPGSSAVEICALIDSYGSPHDTGLIASALVAEGFSTIKIKVARRSDPEEDISVMKEVRKIVGKDVVLRADANRKWTYDEAVKFAIGVKDCCLQYIEEPVNNEDDIVRFSQETGLPVALDETINCISKHPLQVLQKYHHSGVAAVVIKPSVIGGFEKAALVARWAQQLGKMAVVSAAFESTLGLSAYVQFACYLDLQKAEVQRLMNREPESAIAHGFGTYKWFKEEVTSAPLNIHYDSTIGSVQTSSVDAGQFLQKCRINPDVVVRTSAPGEMKEYQVGVSTENLSASVNVLETGESRDGSSVVFLHGFLGNGEDWIPIMKSISSSTKCFAIDIPGHGGTKLLSKSKDRVSEQPNLSIDVIVDILNKVFNKLTPGKVTLVGYSMGARISLYTALKFSEKVDRAVIISGSPGLTDSHSRSLRRSKDDFRASTLISNDLQHFLESWYAEELWVSLRNHPHFKQIMANRLQHDDLQIIGKLLSDMSIGRQPSLWEDLINCKVPLQLVVGEKDVKFKKIACEMLSKLNHKHADFSQVVEIENAGHAVHIENPLAVITAISKFIKMSMTS